MRRPLVAIPSAEWIGPLRARVDPRSRTGGGERTFNHFLFDIERPTYRTGVLHPQGLRLVQIQPHVFARRNIQVVLGEVAEQHGRTSLPQNFLDANPDLRQRLALNGEKRKAADPGAKHFHEAAGIFSRRIELLYEKLFVGANVFGDAFGEWNALAVMADKGADPVGIAPRIGEGFETDIERNVAGKFEGLLVRNWIGQREIDERQPAFDG